MKAEDDDVDICPECGNYSFWCNHVKLKQIEELKAENASLRTIIENMKIEKEELEKRYTEVKAFADMLNPWRNE